DRRDARGNERARQPLQSLREIHAGTRSGKREQERGDSHARDTDLHGTTLVAETVDQCAGGKLARETCDGAERKCEAHGLRSPAVLDQIDGHEYAESRLHGCDEEVHAVQRVASSALANRDHVALLRARGRRAGYSGTCTAAPGASFHVPPAIAISIPWPDTSSTSAMPLATRTATLRPRQQTRNDSDRHRGGRRGSRRSISPTKSTPPKPSTTACQSPPSPAIRMPPALFGSGSRSSAAVSRR